jgi:signal transduction histidine kinase/ligand-binding sensor domain-containing protein
MAQHARAEMDRALGSGQYVHQSWTIREGAPPGVCALVQAPDGYLWLGTGTGLYRFDGVQFTRYRPEPGQHLASSNITALTFTSDGGLWMGSYYGGATLLKNGTLTEYATRDGFPPGWVLDFTEGPQGDLWVATGQGLGHFDGKRWQRIGKDWNYPADRADWAIFDAQGTLWVAAVNQLVYLPHGAKQFKPTNVALAPGAVLALDRHGTLWASDRLHGTRPLRGLSAEHPRLPLLDTLPVNDRNAATRFMFDRAGNLWATSLGTGGVYRVAEPDHIALGQNVSDATRSEAFTAPQTLTSNNTVPIMQDTEGDIWVGTSLGIDSYRPSRVGMLSDFRIDPHAHTGMTRDAAGTIWISSKGTIYRIQQGRIVPVLSTPEDALSLLMAGNDTLWIVGRHDLYRARSGVPEKISMPQHLFSSRLKFVANAGESGGIWASIEGLGIYRFEHDAWQAWIPHTPHLRTSPTSGAIARDGSMWFGYVGSELLYVEKNGQEHFFDTSLGLDIGTISAIDIGAHETLFAGDSGLARLHHNVIQSITDRDAPTLTGITGIIQTPGTDVWLNTGRGIVHYKAAELDKAFDHPGYDAAYELIDYRDGVQGVALQGQPVSTLQIDGTGRIWFITSQVLQWLEPAAHYRDAIPPPVYIKQVVSKGKTRNADQPVRLPKGASSLQIDYTALSFPLPAKVRFKYRLDGFDSAWQDAGTRRQAFYTNLPPGAYRFHVMAANNDDVWNERGAELEIVLPPLFYQTIWFRGLIVLAAAGAISLVLMARVQNMARNIRLQSDARHAERERIARELHDTLLQAVHALMLRFQGIAASISKTDPLQEGIQSTLRIASSFIVDGRNRVRSLRSMFTTTRELADSIIELARKLEKASTIHVDTQLRIDDEDIDPVIGDDVFSICREALLNAFRHANATRIKVDATERKKHLFITIADNGMGICTATLENVAATGHWGLVGMKERSAHIGASLTIYSDQAGTVVTLNIPLRTIKRRNARLVR